MNLKNTTPVPNALLDRHLKDLRPVELKVLLVVIRQTRGWHKEKDWMTISQLVRKTGASRRALSTALDQLVAKDWIQITDPSGSYLHDAIDRRGKSRLIFALTESDESCPLKVPSLDRGQTSRVKFAQQPEQILPTTKETATKGYAKKVRKELEELGILK